MRTSGTSLSRLALKRNTFSVHSGISTLTTMQDRKTVVDSFAFSAVLSEGVAKIFDLSKG